MSQSKPTSLRELVASNTLPPQISGWRVFRHGRPIETVWTESADGAIALLAHVYHVPRNVFTALPEEFVREFERKLERRLKPRLRAACYHEAGHAIVAHHLGAEIAWISTIPQMTHTNDVADPIDSLGRVCVET